MKRAVGALVLLVVGAVFAVPTAFASFVGAERQITVGAHAATLHTNFNGYTIISAGPILPEFRLRTNAPLGIGTEIVLRDSPSTNLEQILVRDAAILSQPQGEIDAITGHVVDILRTAALRGLAAGVVAALTAWAVWALIGPTRRRELISDWPHPWGKVIATGTGLVVVASCLMVLIPRDNPERSVTWVPMRDEFPELEALPDSEFLNGVDVSMGAAVTGSRALIQGAVDTYTDSVEFYGNLAEVAAEVEGIRVPEEDETTAIVVTDRHNNIGMDQVARAIADAAEVSMVINLGDDTSNGASWEAFSINSLTSEFSDVPIVAVAGNHDQGDFISGHMRDSGWIVLDGEPTEVNGVTFLGESDPRSSGLTAGYTGNEDDNIAAIGEQAARLGEAACANPDVSVLMVHSSASSRGIAGTGCVDLILSGHLHRQVGPTVTEGELGPTTALTTASTGGAVYAFALGSKLRRDAQVTLVTFSEGRAVGLQIVTFRPGSIIEVGDYEPVGPALLPDQPDDAPDAPDEPPEEPVTQ